ncbi:MAG: hypothetical protein ABJK25_11920 [Halieaceae bacterium]
MMADAKRLGLKALRYILIFELVYLLIVNSLLQLPLTQTIVNKIRPAKFQVSWYSAWSFYPFRVHATGILASGQSRSQQWQVNAAEANGSIALLPLIVKRVNLQSVHAQDIEYRQRPRLKPEKDYSGLLPFYPEINGWEVQPVDTTARKKKRPWRIALTDLQARGAHQLWIHNIRGTAAGSAVGDLSIEVPGGPFSLATRNVQLSLGPATISGDNSLYTGGQITGAIGFSPFVPRENRGIKLMSFLNLDTGLNLDVDSLSFINLFTGNLGDTRIAGAGKVEGKLRYQEGSVLAGTDVTATAGELLVATRDMQIAGVGNVELVGSDDPLRPLSMAIELVNLSASRDRDDSAFMSGEYMQLTFSGGRYVLPDPEIGLAMLATDEASMERRKNNTLDAVIKNATLTNVDIINDYLPHGSPVEFTGGTAALDGELHAETESMRGGLTLESSAIEMQIGEQKIEADLLVDLVVADGVPREMQFDISGSSIVLDEVSIAGDNSSFDEESWAGVFTMNTAKLTLAEPLLAYAESQVKLSDSRPIVAAFSNQGNPPRWMARLLTMEDIEGDATVDIQGERITVPAALVSSDTSEVAAKVVFYPDGRDGMIYARYKKLDALLKMNKQSSNIDVLRVRQKFDDFVLPDAPDQ